MSKGKKLLLRSENIESVSFYPKKRNFYYNFIPKDTVIKKFFFGLYKKIAKEDLYLSTFEDSFYTREEILNTLEDSYIDSVDNEIYEKPKFVFRMKSGRTFTGFCETIEAAEKEFEKIKNDKDNYLEI